MTGSPNSAIAALSTIPPWTSRTALSRSGPERVFSASSRSERANTGILSSPDLHWLSADRRWILRSRHHARRSREIRGRDASPRRSAPDRLACSTALRIDPHSRSTARRIARSAAGQRPGPAKREHEGTVTVKPPPPPDFGECVRSPSSSAAQTIGGRGGSSTIRSARSFS